MPVQMQAAINAADPTERCFTDMAPKDNPAYNAQIIMKTFRILGLAAVLTLGFAANQTGSYTPDRKAALDKISAKSLEGHLSFIASDLLEGRATPSKGLDIAAEYIAAQFRRAGLEPAGDKGYFQSVKFTPRAPRGSTEAPAEATSYNVVGILRGSDPVLKDTYVLVTAHYDHIGITPNVEGEDKINNGANDDGSGTVGVIELASVLSTMRERPKRSIVFMTFCGEERGMVGSTYYGRNPIFPLKNTVAAINLEHIGRTDDSEGERLNEASMTGFDFSDMGPIFHEAGKPFGVAVTKHPTNSDSFFGRSDNVALARVGIPSHTLCTAFIFPDYHRPGDHWDKINYPNLEKVLKMIGLGLVMLADSPTEPKWNTDNPRTARYVEAWKALKGG